MLFAFGVFLDSFGGTLDAIGADICEFTYGLGQILLPVAFVYTFVRRFILPVRQWVFYGPSLALILNLLMHRLLFQQPWYLPEWPM